MSLTTSRVRQDLGRLRQRWLRKHAAAAEFDAPASAKYSIFLPGGFSATSGKHVDQRGCSSPTRCAAGAPVRRRNRRLIAIEARASRASTRPRSDWPRPGRRVSPATPADASRHDDLPARPRVAWRSLGRRSSASFGHSERVCAHVGKSRRLRRPRAHSAFGRTRSGIGW